MKKRLSILPVLLILAVCLSGCGRNRENAVSTDGSTSMNKVIGALGEAFMENHDGLIFTYNPTGSSAGVIAVQEGTCDIGLSSRYLKDSEKAEGLTETILAVDGIAVIVNPNNPVTDLTLEQLAAVYTGEITNWSDVGGHDGEIVLIGREASSGTRDGFEASIASKGGCRYRQELTSNGAVLTAVSENPNAIGYASLVSVKDTVTVLRVDGVSPTETSIKDGSYPVQRPFVLVTREGVALSETAQRFFDFVTSAQAGGIIRMTGVVPVVE